MLIKIGNQPPLEESQVSCGCCLVSGTCTLCTGDVMCQSEAAMLCISRVLPAHNLTVLICSTGVGSEVKVLVTISTETKI